MTFKASKESRSVEQRLFSHYEQSKKALNCHRNPVLRLHFDLLQQHLDPESGLASIRSRSKCSKCLQDFCKPNSFRSKIRRTKPRSKMKKRRAVILEIRCQLCSHLQRKIRLRKSKHECVNSDQKGIILAPEKEEQAEESNMIDESCDAIKRKKKKRKKKDPNAGLVIPPISATSTSGPRSVKPTPSYKLRQALMASSDTSTASSRRIDKFKSMLVDN